MNRNEKQSLVKSIKNDFKVSESSFIIGVNGLTVEAVQGLRKNLGTKGGKIKVAKNTLLKLATADLPEFSELAPLFKNQIAVVFAKQDTSEVAKIIFNASKENQKLILIGGSLKNKVINKQQVEQLAKLPSREILLAQLCGTLNAPATKLAATLNQFASQLVWVLKQVAERQNNS